MNKKSTYRGSTEAVRRAVKKYQSEKVENLMIRVQKGRREYYKSRAAAAGVSLNSFTVAALDEKIERDHLDTPKAPENPS